MTRSINFNNKEKFDIGGNSFFKSFLSRFDIIRSGFIKADLKCFGKTPELSNKFLIRVIIGAINPMQ